MKLPYLPLTLLIVFITLLQQSSIAQTPPTIWQHCYGGDSTDVISCVKQTADGGFIAAGSTRSSNGDLSSNGGVKGLWVLKLDAAGNIQWEKTYSDTLSEANYIEPTNDGGYILTGDHTIKLHNDGSIWWIDNIAGYTIHQTKDSGYIMSSASTVLPTVTKLHSDGSLDWQQSYDASTTIIGISDVCQSDSYGYIVIGETYDIHPTPFWDKTDNTGNLVAPVVNIVSHSSAGPVCRVGDSTYLYANNFVSGGFGITKFGDNLASVWSAGPFSTGLATGLTSTFDGGFAVWEQSSYSTTCDMTLLKFDTSHNLEWSKSFTVTGSDNTKNILQIANGNYVVAGYIAPGDVVTSGNHGNGDGWIAEIGYNEGIAPLTTATDINIYPVPASNELMVILPLSLAKATIKIISMSGTMVYSAEGSEVSRRLDLSQLSPGQYILDVVSNAKVYSKKFIHY